MRSFIITSLLFTAMCIAIFINVDYIEESSEYIVELVSDENFEDQPEAAITKLENFWKKNHPVVGLSVGFKEIDKMSDLITDLKTYYELGNRDEVIRIRRVISETADEISRLEKFGLENLL